MSDRSLVFCRTQSETPEKPDNSDTFFSARMPDSKVTTLTWGHRVEHPWRYFVAAGESLKKLEQLVAASKTVDADLLAFVKSFGADEVRGGYFIFNNAEIQAIPARMLLKYMPNPLFVCEASTPGDFFPDRSNAEGRKLQREVESVAASESARAELAKKYGAESFDGKVFHFPDWEEHVQAVPPGEKKYRLKSNPLFVHGVQDGRDSFLPDLATDEGMKISEREREIGRGRNPDRVFADWIASFELDISYHTPQQSNRPKAEVEKIGNEWIIKVPVIVEGIYGADGKGGVLTGQKEGWVLPPGAKPISISEYFAKLEKSGSLRAVATSITV